MLIPNVEALDRLGEAWIYIELRQLLLRVLWCPGKR
jgi:hypothetical protein